jgi:Holliday junction resolvase
MNSRNKGKRGELEAAKFLASEGFPARRGQQFSGGTDSPDVVCEALPGMHFEVKRTEKGNPYDWVAQAERDGGYKIPVVLHRRNDHKWLAILPAEQFLRIVRESTFVDSSATKYNES